MAKIIYKDIAIGADADAEYTASQRTTASNLELSDGVGARKDVTLENNRWLLGEQYRLLGNNRVAFWSLTLSGQDCEFSTKPTITIDFDKHYSSQGMTFIFDDMGVEWCSDIDIVWYDGSTVKARGNFQPDAPTFFCEKQATAWNKIVITINKSSLPYHRARIDRIVFGVAREFTDDSIRAATVTNETSLISEELPTSQLEFTLDNHSSVDYLFQFKQPLEVYGNGGSLIGVYYIDKSYRKSSSIYDITANDAIGVLATQTYSGGVWLSGVSAKSLVRAIVGDAFVVEFDASAVDTTLYGLLERQDKRSALKQALFAWGCAATTDGRSTIRVFKAGNTPKTISNDDTYLGVSVQTDAIVTQVNVTAHTFTQDSSGSIEVLGQKYKDEQTIYTVDNPYASETDTQNVKEVDGATLISTHNGEETAQRVYDYYARRNIHKSKIVLNGEKLGDCLSQPTPWETREIGNIEYMRITLSHIVAADIESLGVEAE